MLETTLTVDNFEEEVLNQEGYVLVDFWSAGTAEHRIFHEGRD